MDRLFADSSANACTAIGQPNYPLRIVASRILRSFELDGEELYGDRIQSIYIQSSPTEFFLILLFRHWRPLIRSLLRDFHFFISRCVPQLFLRATLMITPFLIPKYAQPTFSLNCEESDVSIRFPAL
jgi:hypothetical protein